MLYQHQNNPYISPKELKAQQWAAMVYIKPEIVAKEIAEDFQNAVSPSTAIGQNLVNRAEMAHLAKITQELAPQLGAYTELVRYAKLVSKVLTNASVEVSELRRSYSVVGVELSLPAELIARTSPISLPGLPPTHKFEFRIPATSFKEITEIHAAIDLQPFAFESATIELRKSDIFERNTEVIIHRHPQQSQYFIEDLGDGIELEMVQIPGNTFTMGAPEDEKGSRDDERPQHKVKVPTFFMGRYQITQAQWRVVANLPQVERALKPEPSNFKGDNLPVEQVSWYDAIEFCARLSNHSGREYRLPREAEWEYACRAGTTTPFDFGETITGKLANYDASRTFAEETKGKYQEQTTPVGQFPSNSFGLQDMHGNVWEWCFDNYHSNYEGAPTDGSAWIDADENDNCSPKVLRGGSWYSYPVYCRSAVRSNFNPGYALNLIGLRVLCLGASSSPTS